MNLKECESKYKLYIYTHRENVKKAWEALNLICEFTEEDCAKIQPLIEGHDLSKYTEEEFDGYRQHFNPFEDEEVNEYNFKCAWLHHQNVNPHHWQYWVLVKDNGELEVLDMPFEYIVEMVCDWIGCSYMFGDTALGFYEGNKDKMILSPNTREKVEELLISFCGSGESDK